MQTFDDVMYAVQQPSGQSGQQFALKVTRQSNGLPIFDSTGHRLVLILTSWAIIHGYLKAGVVELNIATVK